MSVNIKKDGTTVDLPKSPTNAKVIKDGVTTFLKSVKVIYGGVTKEVWKAGAEVTYVVDTGVTYVEEVGGGVNCLSPTTFTPTKQGYTFVGWREDSVASGEVLSSKVMGSEPITLYAVFSADVTVTYYNNSTTKSTDKKTKYYNNGNTANPSFTLAQASRSGMTARGWSTSNAGNGTVIYENNTAFERDSNVTLYGLYEQTITVTYYTVSDTTKKTKTGTRYWAPAGYINPKFSISPTGYGSEWTFRGWGTSTTADAPVAYDSINNTEFSANATVYCMIYRQVTLSYNGNGATGGSVASHSDYVYLNANASGNTQKLPTFTLKANGYTRTNYSFTGWSLGAVGADVTLSADATATAQWKIAQITTALRAYGSNAMAGWSSYTNNWYGDTYDLTNVSKITFTIDCYYNDPNGGTNAETGAAEKWYYNAYEVIVGVSSNKSSYAKSATRMYGNHCYTATQTLTITLTIDVSALTGNYYVGVGSRGGSTMSRSDWGDKGYICDYLNNYLTQTMYGEITKVVFS